LSQSEKILKIVGKYLVSNKSN